MSDRFEKAFELVVGHEDHFDQTRSDSRNWTSGIVGIGQLIGRKFGINAACYPDTVIADLAIADARAIYRRDYWNPVQADDLPPALALLVFDAAINNGISAAARWLQAAVNVSLDGVIGPSTVAAIRVRSLSDNGIKVCASFQARRVFFMGCLATWPAFGTCWADRLCSLQYQSLTMMES